MSAGSSNESGEGQDFELNLAPIIDCFTVLITYMLVSASFISLDMLEVQIAASGPPPAEAPVDPNPEIPTSISAQVLQNGGVLFHITGKNDETIDSKFEAITENLFAIRKRWPSVEEINVKAESGVEYRNIIKTIESLKSVFKKVYLGE